MRLSKRIITHFIVLGFVFSLSATDTKVADIIKKMTLREKIGQLFVISPEYLNPALLQKERDLKKNIGLTELTQAEKNYYKKYSAGGFVLFAKNVKTPDQLLALNNQLHSLGLTSTRSHIKPFIFIDEEGGMVARIAGNSNFDVPRFENMYLIGSTVADNSNDSHTSTSSITYRKTPAEDAFMVGQAIGNYLKDYDIDVDFAPVADVNTNPANPVIGERAFSSNPLIAGKLAFSMYSGLASQNIGGCLKHYPGHGDTRTDTHLGYAETTKTWDELLTCELLPFIYCINNNASMIMTAHISAPAVTKDKTPASLSPYLINEKLRGELNYNGIVITDSLSMKAITLNYSSADAAVLAFLAGNDFILLPEHYEEAFHAIYVALEKGIISQDRLNQSLERIISYKLEHTK